MTIDRWIALISGVGTFLAFIVVLLTLFEMQKQRKNAIRPEIVIPKLPLFMYSHQYGNVFLVDRWLSNERNSDEIGESSGNRFSSPYQLKAYNIGIGAAKNIDITWDYDIDKMLAKIREMDSNNIFKINYQAKKMLDFEFEKVGVYINTHNDNNHTEDYLLPVSISDKPMTISLPQTFVILWAIIFQLENAKLQKNRNNEIAEFEFEDILLKLHIKYYDIEENTHEQRFRCNINLYGFKTTVESNNDKIVDAMTEIKGE